MVESLMKNERCFEYIRVKFFILNYILIYHLIKILYCCLIIFCNSRKLLHLYLLPLSLAPLALAPLASGRTISTVSTTHTLNVTILHMYGLIWLDNCVIEKWRQCIHYQCTQWHYQVLTPFSWCQ